jgi:hypothetical protein
MPSRFTTEPRDGKFDGQQGPLDLLPGGAPILELFG